MTQQIDFEQEFGVNAGYVEALFERWLDDPGGIDPAWSSVFERLAEPREQPPVPPAPLAPAPAPAPAAERAEPPADGAPDVPEETEHDAFEPLRGIPARIAEAMRQSLEVPTATTFRTLHVKVLQENRAVLNEHMRVRVLGKASYTHIFAFALARALAESPRLQSVFEERGGKPFRRQPKAVNLGLAVDVPQPDGSRALLVPNLKGAERLGFRAFHAAYEDLVRRAREGALAPADFQHTTVTLTNPGGFGTSMSVPRLMRGQGLIVATGAIGVPPEMAPLLAAGPPHLAPAPVMTVTATYDHRVIQGAESGLLLRRLEELLQGADGFYEGIFQALRVPWRPFAAAPGGEEGKALARGAPLEHGEAQANVWKLINAYRVRGSHLADLDPLEYRPDPLPSLDPTSYGFTIWDQDQEFLTGDLIGKPRMTLREILTVLRESYCRRWAVEYMHIIRLDRKHWMRDRIELHRNDKVFDAVHQRRILENLYRAQNFERFLHAAYVGNKRFSLEGADSLIAALAELLDRVSERGVERVVLGMAHRGRLNVLANILNKSTAQIFDEFESVLLPLSAEGSGDVKYHLGQKGVYRTPAGKEVEVYLAANPSHLEAVDPVVCGVVRGLQDQLGDVERSRVLGVLLHGDAAFTGQGVVAETLNMSALRAYESGGTIHVIINNQIGFTTGPRDLRSTYYCSDLAKGIQAPVLHANGDYPEAVLRAVHVAIDYQRAFGKDVVVDMVCYRRWGHNEGDEPAFTQPLLYARIKGHPTVVESYTDLLIRRGDMTRAEAQQIGELFDAALQGALDASRSTVRPTVSRDEAIDLDDDDPADWAREPAPETGVAREVLVEIVDESNRIPEGFVTHPNLLRQLRRRERMVRGEQEVDWGCAEALALGSLLLEGVPVRLAGQDSGRGTFSHRHAVIRDQRTEAEYVPLRKFAHDGVRYEVWDSLLSEEAALAFEYGYALARPSALTVWEAQYGDFVNGAQIPVDQFIVSGESKWKQKVGVVLFLPHGFDGQGPEHSSARPERFLAAASHGNLSVCNCTTSAQFFHLLRRHGRAPEKRPLVVLTPKSLLRDKRAASPIEAFGPGERFRELLGDEAVDPKRAARVVLSSGKVHYDLAAKLSEAGRTDVALVRVEQLYPFPLAALQAELARYPAGIPRVWCQEEPRNMGAWPFLEERLAPTGIELIYAGRPRSASPATGSHARHLAEQQYVIERALHGQDHEPHG